MTAHKVFLIHGMGQHDVEGKWAKKPIDEIKDAYVKLTGKPKTKFEKDFEFIPLTYDDMFKGIRDKWKKEKESLEKHLAATGLSDALIGKIVNITTWGSKDDFFTTHLLDVIFYRFLPNTMKVAVETRIISEIRKQLSDDYSLDWSVMAYSLGTAVAHGALYRKYTGLDADNAVYSSPTNIMMISNVSRILQTDPPVFTSPVRPGRPRNSTQYCSNYISVRNEFDPFLWVKPFEDVQDWPSLEAENNGWYQPIEINHIHQLNTHDLTHYLKNPEVTTAFFRNTLGKYAVSDSNLQKARKAFDDLKLDDVAKQTLEKFKDKPLAKTLVGFVDLLEFIGKDPLFKKAFGK